MLEIESQGARSWQMIDARMARYSALRARRPHRRGRRRARADRGRLGGPHWGEAAFYCQRMRAQRRFLDGHFDEAEQMWMPGLRARRCAPASRTPTFYVTCRCRTSAGARGPQSCVRQVLARRPGRCAGARPLRAGMARRRAGRRARLRAHGARRVRRSERLSATAHASTRWRAWRCAPRGWRQGALRAAACAALAVRDAQHAGHDGVLPGFGLALLGLLSVALGKTCRRAVASSARSRTTRRWDTAPASCARASRSRRSNASSVKARWRARRSKLHARKRARSVCAARWRTSTPRSRADYGTADDLGRARHRDLPRHRERAARGEVHHADVVLAGHGDQHTTVRQARDAISERVGRADLHALNFLGALAVELHLDDRRDAVDRGVVGDRVARPDRDHRIRARMIRLAIVVRTPPAPSDWWRR